jgi:hypothetical protein
MRRGNIRSNLCNIVSDPIQLSHPDAHASSPSQSIGHNMMPSFKTHITTIRY